MGMNSVGSSLFSFLSKLLHSTEFVNFLTVDAGEELDTHASSYESTHEVKVSHNLVYTVHSLSV